MKEKMEQLQIIRFISFGIIFIRHSADWVHFPNFQGNTINAITFFFMLSGLVNAYSMYGRDIMLTRKCITGYMKKKIEKLYPLYFCTLIVSLFTSGFFSHLIKNDLLYVKQQTIFLVRDVFLIQSWFTDGYFSFNGVAWFLSTLFPMCLITVPVLYGFNKVIKREDLKKSVKILILSVIAVLTLTITVIYHYLMHGENDEFWLYIFPVARMGEYITGLCLGYIICLIKPEVPDNMLNSPESLPKDSGAGTSKLTWIIFTVLETFAFLFWTGIMLLPAEPWKYRVVRWLLPNIILLLVFSMGKGLISTIFRNRYLVFLGDISFECFLIHIPVKLTVEFIYEHLHPTHGALPDTLMLIITLILIIYIGNVIHGFTNKQNNEREQS